MDLEARRPQKEDETEMDQITESDRELNALEEHIREAHKRDEYPDEDFHEDCCFDECTNMWRYDLATEEASPRFCTLFKDLVMKYLRPVKRKYARRPLEKGMITTIVLNQLQSLGVIYMKPVEGDPEKFIVFTCDSEKKSEIEKKYSSMSKEEKLHKQELEKFEDNSYSVSRPLSHNRKLRDYKIDNLKSETDETSECDISAKPSTSSTE
ncbi:uncharacterized protein LOC109856420 [Pseudomyrmex gracilis]|uniref:uncharacterized protein LOC109856420 n=1 Tax=Pseudomyrmex gracilis TaxID=219809 RepID=UPI000994AECF|nr:uncharacterized protein LOC109856420 [Pseudomyrmex gracilis]